VLFYIVDAVYGESVYMISKKAKYALKATLSLAREYKRAPVLISDLAREEDIPKKFLEQILLDLKNHGLLRSKTGKGGGYILSKSPDSITFGQILRIIDGPMAPVPCVSKTAYAKCPECKKEMSCGIRMIMNDLHTAMSDVLDNASLSDALERSETAIRNAAEVPMYHI
jgi:Rrf2 family protein